MIPFDAERVLANVRKAKTRDLLNRVTVYRGGMEPAALAIIENELADRGVDATRIAEYRKTMEADIIAGDDGVARRCSFCDEPAVRRGWGMHKLFGKIPIFPRFLHWCREHKPG